jgi:hypothetical protein
MAGQYAGETIPKCKDGVYDPHGDQAYCSVCNPKVITGVAKVKSFGPIKVGIFKNPNEFKNQLKGFLSFVSVSPDIKKLVWYAYALKNTDAKGGL